MSREHSPRLQMGGRGSEKEKRGGRAAGVSAKGRGGGERRKKIKGEGGKKFLPRRKKMGKNHYF